MKNYRTKLIGSLATVVLLAGPFEVRASEAQRQQPRAETRKNASSQTDQRSTETTVEARQSSNLPSSMTAAGGKVRLALDEAEERSSKKLEGKEVRSSDGQDLGTIKDFVIDTQQGKITHVVVSFGGILGIGDRLRVAAIDSLQQAGTTSGAADRLTLRLSKSEFDQLPMVQEKDLQPGQLQATVSQSSTQRDTAQSSGRLLLASDISGKELHENNREIGEIDSVVVDFSNGSAEALIDVRGAGEKVMVAFSELQIAADADVVTTTLSPADITSIAMTHSIIDSRTPATAVDGRSATATAGTMAESTASVSAGADGVDTSGRGTAYSENRDSAPAARRPASSDEQLAATGRVGGEDQDTGGNAEAAQLATSIRRAFAEDQRFARENITVTPAQGRIVLRGTVSSEDLKTEAEEFAKGEARGQSVENELRVQNRSR